GPFQVGEAAIQFFAQPPEHTSTPRASNRKDPNFLRAELQERLHNGSLIYDFYVQFFVDEDKTPIEDGAKRWELGDARPMKIAQLVIPQQDLSTTAALNAAETVQGMGFNPWNSAGAEQLKPLGSLNRARQTVYMASAALRDEGSLPTASRCPVFRIVSALVRGVEVGLTATNRFINWSDWAKLNPYIGVLNLIHVRRILRQKNLVDTETLNSRAFYEQGFAYRGGCPVMKLVHRTADGSYNDLSNPHMGRAGTRFGRNIPLDKALALQRNAQLLTPNPRAVAQALMTRKSFQPVLQLNLLAAAWIQFMIHGWFFHEADSNQSVAIEVDPQDQDWTGPRPMQVQLTKVDPRALNDPQDHPTTFLNRESHWWDGSQIYGSTQAIQDKVRSHQDGKLRVDERGLLPKRFESSTSEINALEATGLTENWWLGMGLMHSLFTLEHNAICDRLKANYPRWDDEQLFQTARLVNAALMAKIHTVEWTVAILNHPTLKISLNTNWWGLFGERFHDLLDGTNTNEVLHGIPGSPKELSGVPYALTEEFTSVYRLHPLLPDDLVFHSVANGHQIEDLQWLGMEPSQSVASLADVVGPKARTIMEHIDLSDLFYSFGLMHPGAVALDNYPNFLRTLRHEDSVVDLAAVEIFRDRERGVPRYNEFRRQLHMKPAASFQELVGGNETLAQRLADVYGDIEEVDVMVGLFAEQPLPSGFGFSDTAFRLFILMAARRLNCDRFFTTDYTPEVYSPEGMAWINENTMQTVLLRHFPQLEPALRQVDNAFFPWNRVGGL
ncbi:MAG TPA: peroxidase family protein, partial [Stenomitos sp.]